MAEQKVAQKVEHKVDTFNTNTNVAFSIYDVVLIHSLKNRPELNDKFATIRAYSTTKGRYHVRIQCEKKDLNILLKPSNLKMIYPILWTKYIAKLLDGIACSICHSSLSISNIISCPNCMAIYYCSKQCMKEHLLIPTTPTSYNHGEACQAYKKCIYQKYEMFQQRLGHFKFDVFDDKLDDHRNWMQTKLYKQYINNRNKINQTLMTQMTKNPKLLTSWKEWYKFHQISDSLPVALRYHFPMTIYWILQKHHVLSRKSASIYVVHLVGVDNEEIDTLYEWTELSLLYPAISFIFICIGPDIPEKYVRDKKIILAGGSIKFHFYRCLYDGININKYVDKRFKRPDFIIGFNAGLGEYDGSWESAIKYMVRKQITAYFTEYALYTVLLSSVPLIKKCKGSVKYIEHNPFLSPRIALSANKCHRCFYAENNIIYGINVETQNNDQQ